ncbi:phage tail tape measure protein [Streptomyces tagetis]|uniref:Phage tail tape measure protein n=1 Tax=Streptomyces tagetis TaxID=2820809 RepID=A0A940XID1_9ACTN|nr:phage tail tape measure protein [Streptomyces sp. RG38]MBQ0827717.1 phage tail tape measure protein [Streptomyces sp. RG38]
MALTVGELNAVLAVDDRAVAPALRRAEQAMRQAGQRMGSDAGRAGQQAGQQLGEGVVQGADGQWRDLSGGLVDAVTAATSDAEAEARRGGQQTGEQLGDGLVRGADGRLRDARGRFHRAGRDAGDAAGDGLAEGLSEGADEGVDQAGGKLEKLKGIAGGAALAAGAAAGALLIDAIGQSLEQGKITARLGAQLGATGPEAQRYGKIAGKMFAGAITEDFQGAADAIRAVAAEGLLPPGATNAQIKTIATRASDLATTFDIDLAMAAQAAGNAVKTGLAKNSTEAFDMIAKGMAGLGPAGEDLIETVNEYGVQFAKSGLSGRTAFGLMRQSIQAGWKDTDKVADAFKELELRVTGGGKAQVEALKSVGLSADEMIEAVSAGGKRGEEAMAKIVDAIVELGPESNDAKVAIQDLFGGPGEDLGAAFFKLNLHEAAKEMGDTAGAADQLGDSLRNNAASKLEAFKRGLQQGLVDATGGAIIKLGELKGYLGGLWDEAGKGGEKGVDRVVSFFEILGKRLLDKAQDLAPKAIEALSGLGQKAADYIMANPMQVLKIAAIAGAVIMAFSALPALIGAGIGATVGLIIAGFVTRLIDGAREKLPEWGEAIGGWFGGLWSTYISGPVGRTWDSFMGTVRGLPSRAVGALAALGGLLAVAAATHWQRFRDAAGQKATAFIGWVRGLPGQISRGVGSLSSLLTGKGKAVVQGLWSGISSMGGWIKSKIMGWARSVIPAPVAKALGIGSPSKVMARAVGRWIPRGIVAGIESTAGELDRTMAGLVTTPTASASYASAASSAAGGSGTYGARPPQTVRLVAGDAFGDLVISTIRTHVGGSGGSVQFVLGR